jgi:hypothetical protein
VQKQDSFVGHGRHKTVAAALCLLVLAGLSANAQGQQANQGKRGQESIDKQNDATTPGFRVKAPPRPLGSILVRVQGGLDKDEIGRNTRAHRHKANAGKDIR